MHDVSQPMREVVKTILGCDGSRQNKSAPSAAYARRQSTSAHRQPTNVAMSADQCAQSANQCATSADQCAPSADQSSMRDVMITVVDQ
jgi:hypothetical protein